jgi:two-component system, sensor histidine kinase and response regulator
VLKKVAFLLKIVTEFYNMPYEHEATVLYVDDEASNRLVFERLFDEKFKVITASSGREALEILKKEFVGVLVTDQRMDEMSGNELLMRAKELYPDIIRIVITAYSDLEPIVRAVNEGFVARYIIKPWNNEELEQILHWGIEAFTLGHHNSALHLRLMQTERLVTLGSIGAAIIHDLNQPLSYLSSNAERLSQLASSVDGLNTLLAAHGTSLPSKQLATLQELANELPEITRDMMTGCALMQELTSGMSKILRPMPRSKKASVDPIPVIRYAMSVCRSLIAHAQGQLLYDGPTSLPQIQISHGELGQVLINLMANAAQALQRRGGPDGVVTVSASAQKDRVRFVISDNGPGMSKEVQDKLGTLFFSTREEGTGLGIAQCQRIIQKHHGEWQLSSKEGKGTVVTFVLPQAQSNPSD